jgi:hypothetical protein
MGNSSEILSFVPYKPKVSSVYYFTQKNEKYYC